MKIQIFFSVYILNSLYGVYNSSKKGFSTVLFNIFIFISSHYHHNIQCISSVPHTVQSYSWSSPCLHSGCWTVELTGASRSAIMASVSHAPAHQAWWRRVPALRRHWANFWIWAALSDEAAQIPSPLVERHAANPWPVAPVVRKRGQHVSESDSMHPKSITFFCQLIKYLFVGPPALCSLHALNNGFLPQP